MKESKFRVWDKKTNIMLQGIELNKLLGYLMFQSCPNSDAYNLMKDHFKELVWLEFTGLKDKNSEEIYEGDILTHEDKDLHVVEYNCGRWSARLVKHVSSRWPAQYLDCTWMHWEVIGNIYETPEKLPKVNTFL